MIKELKKPAVVNIYEDLLSKLWDRIVVSMGAVTVTALWRRVIRKTSGHFPFIEGLSVSNDGFDFSQIRKMNEKEKIYRNGFEELILNFFDLVTELTGDMIIDRLFKEKIMDEIKE